MLCIGPGTCLAASRAEAHDRQTPFLSDRDIEQLYPLSPAGQAEKLTEGAVSEFREAVQAHPDDSDALLQLGIALERQGGEGAAEAVALLEKASRLRPDDGVTLVHLGHACVLAGELTKAADAFERARRAADSPEAKLSALLGLAGAYEAQGKFEEARELCEQAFARAPRLKHILRWARLREKERRKAREILAGEGYSPRWYVWAAAAAGYLRDEIASDDLVRLLDYEDTTVRAAVAWALSTFGDAGVLPALIRAMRHDWPGNYKSVAALGPVAPAVATFGKQAVAPLIETLKDPYCRDLELANTQHQAILALGLIGSREAVPALASFLVENEGSVDDVPMRELQGVGNHGLHTSLAWALAEIGDPRAIKPLIASLRVNDLYVNACIRQQIARMGRAAVRPLIAALEHPHFDVRASSARVLGSLRDARALDPLIEALSNAPDHRKSLYVAPIGDIILWGPGIVRSDPRAVNALLEELKRCKDGGLPADRSRIITVQVLGLTRERRAFEPILHVFQHAKRYFVRAYAALALGHLRDRRAVEPLIELTESITSEDRRQVSDARSRPLPYAWTIEALGKIGDARAVPLLRGVLLDPRRRTGFLRAEAAVALARIGVQGLPPLLEASGHKNVRVRWAAERAARELSDPEAVEPLLRIVESHAPTGAGRGGARVREARRARLS
ncbi:MAG: HEAT repeat domain-containing protein, partial [Planctomycetota bacterium]